MSTKTNLQTNQMSVPSGIAVQKPMPFLMQKDTILSNFMKSQSHSCKDSFMIIYCSSCDHLSMKISFRKTKYSGNNFNCNDMKVVEREHLCDKVVKFGNTRGSQWFSKYPFERKPQGQGH